MRQLQRARVEQHRLAEKLHSAMRRNLELQRSRASQSARMLNSLSPLTTVERGYGIVREANDRVVSDVAQLTAGDTVRTRLRDGWFDATVKDIHSEPLPTAGTD